MTRNLQLQRVRGRARRELIGRVALTSVALALHPRVASAAFEYHLTATGDLTYTDNINNAPDDTDASATAVQRNRETGFLCSLTPGASISLVEPRGQAGLSYSLPMTYSTSEVVPSTISHALVGAASYELGPQDNAGVSVALTKSTLTALLFNSQAPTTVTGINNADNQDLVRLQASEFWARQWTELISTQQTTTYGTQIDVGSSTLPNTRILTNGLTARYDHNIGTIALAATETATHSSGGDSKWRHLLTGTLSWTRLLDPLTSLTLTAGAAKTLGGSWGPIGGASLQQSLTFTAWSLSVERNQTPDLQTGRIFTRDAALASLSVTPFETTPIRFSASGGASQFEAGPTGKVVSFQAQASIGYAHRYVLTSLSYVFLRQVSDEDGPNAIPSLTRNAVTLTLGGVYPPQ